MARKKTDIDNTEQAIDTNVQEVGASTRGNADDAVAETPVQSNEDNAGQVVAKVQKAKTEIPVAVDKLLKVYNNYEQLYIDAKGSVYTADTQPNLVGNAILYQNPYYQS